MDPTPQVPAAMSSAPGAPPPIPPFPSISVPSLNSSFGAIQLSTFFSLMLYGLTAHQTYRYFRMYRADILFYKLLVVAIFLADSFHSAILMHICYYYLVVNYFNPLAFLVSVWTVQVLPLATGITVLLTQSFYVRRIFLVNRRYKPVVILVVVMMLVELGFIVGASVESFGNSSFDGLSGHVWVEATLFAVAASVDLILTGTLILILRNSRTRFTRTNQVLDTLAVYAVIATSINTALTVPAFICSIALPDSFVYFAIAIPATKVYSNSVLAVLNCRQSLATELRGDSGQSAAPIRLRGLQNSNTSGSVPPSQPTLVSSPAVATTTSVKISGRRGDVSMGATEETLLPQDEEHVRKEQAFEGVAYAV